MAEIKCPNCGTIISLEQSDLDSIVQQVRDEQFQHDLDERIKLLEAERESAIDAVRAQAKTELATRESQLDAQIAELRAQLVSQAEASKAQRDLALAQAQSDFEAKRLELEASIKEKDALLASQEQTFEAQKELAIAQAVSAVEKERDELQSSLSLANSQHELAITQAIATAEKERDELSTALKLKDSEHEAAEARLREQMAEQQRRHEDALNFQKEEIERLKDMKARLSTKMVGETLEHHCQYEFDRIRAVAFPNAYFEKDNDASQGTKGDFIFRESDEEGNEIISIMFEMKNESDSNSVKKKNEDHFAKLDKDRTKKNCEYAVLVSLLEPENELYNEGIVDVSYRYPKMYVIRPQFFIPIISLLRNAALNSLEYKRELALVRQQDLDITNFEHDLDLFKEGFFRNFQQASDRFEDAIEGIERTIKLLEKIKDNLTKSEKHLTAANNKLDDLTVKKLTRKNPTMKAKFEALAEEGSAE